MKLMINVGKNTVSDYAIPVRQTLEKTKAYEIRTYETNKYVQIQYQIVESTDPSKKKKKSESKQGNDDVMAIIWKLMGYTQGDNDQNLHMKLIMPIFVGAETLENEYKGSKEEKLVEVTVFLSLPAEYQVDKNDASKVPLEPPKANDASISFQVIVGFKCYVGTFGGFASDDSFKEETGKLKQNLAKDADAKVTYNDNKVICISYDPPFKLFGRTNEVLLISN